MKKYNNISTYDKSDNLVDYIEFKDTSELKCYYNVNGDTLTKKYYNEFYEEGVYSSQLVNSIMQFDENIMLFPRPIVGETHMEAIPSGGTFVMNNLPNISSSIFVYEDDVVEDMTIHTFTIKSNLIDECLNKL